MLGIRVKEHLAGKRRRLLTPLGKHRLEDHQGEDFDIKCKILAYENEIGARKILEALYIRERNPKLNNRNHRAILISQPSMVSHCSLIVHEIEWEDNAGGTAEETSGDRGMTNFILESRSNDIISTYYISMYL
ncbi:hypothetical protein V3C99_018241 [Haemonchus contortus]